MRRARAGRAWVAAAAVVLGVAACQNAAGPPEDVSGQLVQADLARTFTLAPGQVARVGRDGPFVGFRRVLSDSRCPMDAVCVWMGDAVVQIEFGDAAAWVTGELHTDPGKPPLDVGGYRIRLTELQPYPQASEPIRADRYRATLLVERR